MDAACTIQDSIHVFSLVRKYVSRILGTYHQKRYDTGDLIFTHSSFYNNWIPASAAALHMSSGQREDWTSPIWALRRKNIQIRD